MRRNLKGPQWPATLYIALLLITLPTSTLSGQVDLTTANRRPPSSLPGLPDWSRAGFEEGKQDLPTSSQIGRTITAAQLRDTWGVIPDDGQDDTEALQRAVSSSPGVANSYTLILLPAGVINLSYMIYLEASYVILRGVSNDPNTGTRLVFLPDVNTKYDKLTSDGSQWDIDAMTFSWSYPDPDRPGGGVGGGGGHIQGMASSGWLWPGRSIFRVGSRKVAEKFLEPHRLAPDNRKDLFLGSANYHWSIDKGKTKGFLALQTIPKAGVQGTNRVYVDPSTPDEYYTNAKDVWIGSPVKYNDYKAWGVKHMEYYVNSYVFQDWHTVTSVGTDNIGTYLELDRPLRFDLYSTSIADGSPVMDDAVSFGKIMPINDIVRNVGIEDLYMTQPLPGFTSSQAEHEYGNLDPESAMHGIVFRFAKNCWVRNVRTFMTGSHPIATETAKNIQIQDNLFDGAWNKGKGGNGYLRGSRVWDSVYYNNTLRNLRHITMQWSSFGNVVILNNMTNDMNLHGGYEGYNLFELNFVSVPFSHRSGACTTHCGGEGGSSEGGTWWPIYWSTGDKASKWAGATGPQNIFYRNYLLKIPSAGAESAEYLPYFARDGSLSNKIWQFGWDRNTPRGDHYQHLSDGPLIGDGLLLDWQGHETQDWSVDPLHGVNPLLSDEYTSLFLRDVTTNATSGVPTFSTIAGYAYCRGNFVPKTVGYYLSTADTRSCQPWGTNGIDYSAYSHVLFAYGTLGSDGTVSLTTEQQSLLRSIVSQKKTSKIYLAVGGWGLGTDATTIRGVAVNSGGSRTRMATSLATLCSTYGLDGVDIEWATSITASQFTVIATTVKTALATKAVSLSVPRAFWDLSGINAVTITLRDTVEFISLFSHSGSSDATLVAPHSLENIQATVKRAQQVGMFPDKLIMPIPFYGRTYKLSSTECVDGGCPIAGPGRTSECIPSGALGQNTLPYYALESVLENGRFDGDLLDETWTDEKTEYRTLTMEDGSITQFDDPTSVTYKVGRAVDLCMGGVAAFSIDQDSFTMDLTTAIWDAGGLVPNPSDLAHSLGGPALTGDGFIDEGYWDRATTSLANDYPWLPALTVYRTLLHVALQAQAQLSNRLRGFMQFTALNADSFELYQRWETKALNWALANATGYGRQYWTCSESQGGQYSPTFCPHVFEEKSKDLRLPGVWWRLTDRDGFRTLVNDTIGLDIDDLIIGSLWVDQDLSNCVAQPSFGLGNKTIDKRTTILPSPWSAGNLSYWADRADEVMDDGTGRIRRVNLTDTTHRGFILPRAGPSPYDPDPDCKALWSGLFQVNATTLFPTPPAENLKSWIDSHEAITTLIYSHANSLDATVASLNSLLESVLTTISIGDGSVETTEAYIRQVEYDRDLQEAFDQALARTSGLQLLLDIVLTVISFIPGLGQIGAVAQGALRAVISVGDITRIARLTKIVKDLAPIGKILQRGGRTGTEVSYLGRNVDAFLLPSILTKRGRLGSKFAKNKDRYLTCLEKGVDILMDVHDLATSLFDSGIFDSEESDFGPQTSRIRSLGIESHCPSSDLLSSLDGFSYNSESQSNSSLPLRRFQKRAKRGGKDPCIFEITSAEKLKGLQYEKKCKSSTNAMDYNTEPDGSGAWVRDTYSKCKETKSRKDQCKCDHILEGIEVKQALQPAGLTEQEKKDLCASFPDLTLNIMRELNSADNLEGLWGPSSGWKSNLVDPLRMKDRAHLTSADESLKSLQIAKEYITTYQSRRARVAQVIDRVITDAHNANTSPPGAWTKIYQPGIVDASRAVNDRGHEGKLDRVGTHKVRASNKNGKRGAPPSEEPSCTKKGGKT